MMHWNGSSKTQVLPQEKEKRQTGGENRTILKAIEFGHHVQKGMRSHEQSLWIVESLRTGAWPEQIAASHQ